MTGLTFSYATWAASIYTQNISQFSRLKKLSVSQAILLSAVVENKKLLGFGASVYHVNWGDAHDFTYFTHLFDFVLTCKQRLAGVQLYHDATKTPEVNGE